MTPLNQIKDTDIYRWFTIFSLLSMELTEKFLTDIGLDTEACQLFRHEARQFVQEYERLTNSSEGGDYIIGINNLLKKTFIHLQEKTGANNTRQLYYWGTYQFPYGAEQDTQEFLWKFLLRKLASVENTEIKLVPLELNKSKVERLVKNVQIYLKTTQLLIQRLEQVEQEQRTIWEQKIFQLHLDSGSPLNWIANTAEYHSFHKIWREIQKTLNTEELLVLLEWAKQQAKYYNMPAELLELPSINKTKNTENSK